jgi:FtsP/CotA-like multicopper oxidase with cupredoxin domain
VQPDATWSPTWTIDQPAATLWYHPHPHGETETHVYRGLAGMFILDDGTASGLALPREYGVDDIPVIVQDRNFTRNGQFHYERGQSGTGILGDTLLVNGTVAPYLDVTTERVRLRLLNASNTRVYDFGLADDRSFAWSASMADSFRPRTPPSGCGCRRASGRRSSSHCHPASGSRSAAFPPPLPAVSWATA